MTGPGYCGHVYGIFYTCLPSNPWLVSTMQCEMGWRKEAVNLENWVTQYWKRRYHSASPTMGDAWRHLTTAVYQANFDVGMKSLIERAPEFQMYRCVCVCVCPYICTYSRCLCFLVWKCVCMCTHICVWVLVNVCISVCGCMRLCVYCMCASVLYIC